MEGRRGKELKEEGGEKREVPRERGRIGMGRRDKGQKGEKSYRDRREGGRKDKG